MTMRVKVSNVGNSKTAMARLLDVGPPGAPDTIVGTEEEIAPEQSKEFLIWGDRYLVVKEKL